MLNSRHLLYEAQQAYFYGLPAHQAIASVTSTPSLLLGLDHRIGFVKAGVVLMILCIKPEGNNLSPLGWDAGGFYRNVMVDDYLH